MKKSKKTSSQMIQRDIKKQEQYSNAEIRRIVKASNGSEIGIAVQLATETGIRKGELSALKWDQVDTKARKIDIPCRKGIAPDRTVAISEELARVLDIYKVNNLGAEYVFGRFAVHSLMVSCRKADVPLRGFHHFRHPSGLKR